MVHWPSSGEVACVAGDVEACCAKAGADHMRITVDRKAGTRWVRIMRTNSSPAARRVPRADAVGAAEDLGGVEGDRFQGLVDGQAVRGGGGGVIRKVAHVRSAEAMRQGDAVFHTRLAQPVGDGEGLVVGRV